VSDAPFWQHFNQAKEKRERQYRDKLPSRPRGWGKVTNVELLRSYLVSIYRSPRATKALELQAAWAVASRPHLPYMVIIFFFSGNF
jgi:hypothetical protein